MDQETVEEAVEELIDAHTQARMAEDRLHSAVVRAKDDAGLTFREIGSILGLAHSWVYKLYKREKNQTGQDVSGVRRQGPSGRSS